MKNHRRSLFCWHLPCSQDIEQRCVPQGNDAALSTLKCLSRFSRNLDSLDKQSTWRVRRSSTPIQSWNSRVHLQSHSRKRIKMFVELAISVEKTETTAQRA